jgi:hypothetical protein
VDLPEFFNFSQVHLEIPRCARDKLNTTWNNYLSALLSIGLRQSYAVAGMQTICVVKAANGA